MFNLFGEAQSLTGTRGLIHIPTAELYPDKTLAIGASFLPSPYMNYLYSGSKDDFDSYTTYVTVTVSRGWKLCFDTPIKLEMK